MVQRYSRVRPLAEHGGSFESRRRGWLLTLLGESYLVRYPGEIHDRSGGEKSRADEHRNVERLGRLLARGLDPRDDLLWTRSIVGTTWHVHR